MNKSGILPRRHSASAANESCVVLALVVFVSLAAPPMAVAERGADVVPVQAQTSARGRRQYVSHGRRPAGSFCWHPDERNDVINMAVAPGTEAHAVESGRIAYAGDELRGFLDERCSRGDERALFSDPRR
jgi:hypothetical protein